MNTLSSTKHKHTNIWSNQRGSVPIYITLVLLLIVTSSAIILSGVLSQQLKISQNVVAAERAFYASNSGLEEALYNLVQLNNSVSGGNTTVNGSLEYGPNDEATYNTTATLILNPSKTQSRPCLLSTGTYAGQERRINLHSPGDQC